MNRTPITLLFIDNRFYNQYNIVRRNFMSKEIKTGLILEGGAMRGMFTAGVLDVFMENNITFDGTIGVSAGATFGCNIKSKQIGRAIRYNIKYSKDKRYCSISSLFRTGDLYGADFCYNQLPNELDVFDLETYRTNPMKFYCVASDCKTGLPIYKELPLCDAHDLCWMRASASMPLASKIVHIDGYDLLDGGMTDSIPYKYFESIGYNRNIVVLTQPKNYQKSKNKLIPVMKILLKKYPRIVNAMANRHVIYNQTTKELFEKEAKGEILVICPDKSLSIKRTEKNTNELQRVYEEGRNAAQNRLQEIKCYLENM